MGECPLRHEMGECERLLRCAHMGIRSAWLTAKDHPVLGTEFRVRMHDGIKRYGMGGTAAQDTADWMWEHDAEWVRSAP